MTESSIPEPPKGAGGKSTNAFNSANNWMLSDGEINRVADAVGKCAAFTTDLEDHDTVLAENSARASRNAAREAKRSDPNFIEEISDDEPFLDDEVPQPFTPLPRPNPGIKMLKAFSFLSTLTPNTAKRVVSALTGADASSSSTVTAPSASASTSTSTSTDTLVFKDSDMVITRTADTGTEIPWPILNLAVLLGYEKQ
jgi:hypothetical protein